MTPFLNSVFLVTIAEMGDKTQLLSILLASRYKPLPVILGVFCATLLNHAVAAYVGQWASSLLHPTWMHYVVALLFIAIGVWVLIPDSAQSEIKTRRNAFLTSLAVFFLAEMGDKTQLATITLGADYPYALAMVVAGTTLGMMIANVPAILLGGKLLQYVNIKKIQVLAALCFIGIGIASLAQGIFF